MPLIVEGKTFRESTPTLEQIIEDCPYLKASSRAFCSQPVREVAAPGLLYVHQRECATVFPVDGNVTVIGSEDATTCHIVFIRNKATGMTSLAHLDGCGMREALVKMIQSVKHQGNELELHMFGGFMDEKKLSKKITNEILAIIHQHTCRTHLCTACVTDLNDVKRNGQHRPIVYGAAMDVKTGLVFCATFPGKGPDGSLRHVRTFTGGKEVLQVYSPSTGELQIGPFDYKPFSDASFFMNTSDETILQYLSTSPHCEPDNFCDGVRATMKYMVDNPLPLKTVFPDGTPHRYAMDSSKEWEPVLMEAQ